MESKLEALVQRLERAVERLEAAKNISPNASTNSTQSTTTSTQSQAQTSQQTTTNDFMEKFYSDFLQKAQETENADIVDMTQITVDTFRWVDKVIGFAASAKRPTDDVFKKIADFIRSKAKIIDDKYIYPRKLTDHGKTLKEGIGAALWILTVQKKK